MKIHHKIITALVAIATLAVAATVSTASTIMLYSVAHAEQASHSAP